MEAEEAEEAGGGVAAEAEDLAEEVVVEEAEGLAEEDMVVVGGVRDIMEITIHMALDQTTILYMLVIKTIILIFVLIVIME
jgi:hypothetical protein